MTHEDEGHYAGKHPPGTVPDPELAKEVGKAAKDGRLSCGAAERICAREGVEMTEVGKTADLMELRIVKCQMGLFGHDEGPGEHGKLVDAAAEIPDGMERQIRDALEGGRLPCAAAWKIARGAGCSKKQVARVCEKLKIKIKPCQLGAF